MEADYESLIKILGKHKPELSAETTISAAVMLLIVIDDEKKREIVITKRALTLPYYAGHYSLPGGMRDPEDADLYVTATREVNEELGLHQDAYQRIGQLNDFYDRYNNLIRPFVSIMKKSDFLELCKPSTDEICEIYFFSFAKQNLIKDDPTLYTFTRRRPSFAFKEDHVYIWGLTAAILAHFFSLLPRSECGVMKRAY